ncbi:MAG: hypothetical protein ACREQQ_14625 [Candidatus Binatia bacterium]
MTTPSREKGTTIMLTNLLSPFFAVVDLLLDSPQALVVITSAAGIAYGILFLVN